MKKSSFIGIGCVSLLVLTILSCGFKPKPQITTPVVTTPEVGTLTAYYATESFNANDRDFKKGQLICDTNDPINRIVVENTQDYKYEGDEGGGYYSWLLPKTKAEKVTYTMNQLPTSLVGEKAIFKSQEGLIAKIFKANINGHKYYSYTDDFQAYYDEEATKQHAEFLAIKVEFISVWDNDKYVAEMQLNTKGDYIDLYHTNKYGEGVAPSDCRYREGLIGFLEEEWVNAEGWEETAYSEDGKLLVDQYSVKGSIPNYYSVAYIAELDALYWGGTLYYRQK